LRRRPRSRPRAAGWRAESTVSWAVTDEASGAVLGRVALHGLVAGDPGEAVTGQPAAAPAAGDGGGNRGG
jgi:hypothetical protein